MGSILNFIIPSSKCVQQGPVTNYIQNDIYDYKYTTDYSIVNGYKNILLVESKNGHKGFRDCFLDDDMVAYIIKSDIMVLMCTVADPGTEADLKKTIDFSKKLEIYDKIRYIDSNVNLEKYDNVDAFHYFLEEAIQSKEIFFHSENNDLGYVSKKIQEADLDAVRSKKFLCFSRNNDKPHRLSLLHDYLTNDLSDSYFSFLQTVKPYCKTYHGDDKQLLPEEYNSIIPLELDTIGYNVNQFRTDNTLQKELFIDSVINIASETSFENNELFISEKIIKPIISFQPFIVIGPCGYLSELKRLGFKTFSDFWDESYDEIENPKDRYLKIRKLILELNTKTIKELNLLYKSLKHICIYNNTHFNEYKVYDSMGKIFKKLQ